jgi:hypothetical protein
MFKLIDYIISDIINKRERYKDAIQGISFFVEENILDILEILLTLFLFINLIILVYIHINEIKEYYIHSLIAIITSVILWWIVTFINYMKK